MSDPVYVVNLGSGMYLDDQGVLHQGPLPPVPSYAVPGGLFTTLNDIAKLAKTFNDIGGAIPNEKDAKRYKEFTDKLSTLAGEDGGLAEFLGAVGAIASVIGTVFVAVGVAVAAAKLLGLFNEGPSPLEQLVKARFDALDREIRALQVLSDQKKLNDQRNALVSARSTVHDFVAQRDSGTMSAAQTEQTLETLAAILQSQSADQFIALIDPVTYTGLFDADQYQHVWPWIARYLYRVPTGSPPVPALFPPMNSPAFDHRLAVALAPQSAQTMLALVRSLYPEFRTTGNFRSTLRDFATKLTDLATTIRNTTLARTIYREGDFGYLVDDFYVSDPVPGFGVPTLTDDYYVTVGALDLCNGNDAFFPDVNGGFGPPPGPSRRGSLDFRWHPPAVLKRAQGASGMVHPDGSPVIQYRIVNGQQCADAANDLSLQDYSDLLLSSGYLTLAHLAVQMRHATTQPQYSETVHGNVVLQRLPKPGSVVTVTSAPGPVLFTAAGHITAPAWREKQQVRAFVACSTQQIPRPAPLIHYRVLLRTLASGFPPNGWHHPDYNTAVQTASYVDDALNPGFQRLVLSTSMSAVLHEELLIEGTTEAGVRHVERTLSFAAHTFDWWIPSLPAPGVSDHALATATNRHVFGTVTAGTPVLPKRLPEVELSGQATLEETSAASVVLGLGWTDGAQTWQGEHREMSEATVEMQVSLDWHASDLRVTIENRPEDRNYTVFLVVEETFGSVEPDETAPKVLHTAFPIDINGQLTSVPQRLFDDEKAARDKQRAFAQKYAISLNPKPGQPVIDGVEIRTLATDAGVEQLAAAMQQLSPDEFKALIHPRPED